VVWIIGHSAFKPIRSVIKHLTNTYRLADCCSKLFHCGSDSSSNLESR